MTWPKGADTVEALVESGELERVEASKDLARSILDDARRHLASARAISATDPLGAYALAYDAGRKALSAILEAQGLRATSKGGHIVLFDAAMAQFDPPLGGIIRPFNRMRARRNQVEYASTSNPIITSDEVLGDIPKSQDLLDLADKVLPQLDRF